MKKLVVFVGSVYNSLHYIYLMRLVEFFPEVLKAYYARKNLKGGSVLKLGRLW
jgi:hypothetical protein